MLDLRTEKFLSVLKNICPEGGYVIASIDDFPVAEFGTMTELELNRILTQLSSMGYINLRFLQGDEFCCSILQKGRDYEPVAIVKTGFFVRNKPLVVALLSFASAFLGAMLGGLLF